MTQAAHEFWLRLLFDVQARRLCVDGDKIREQ